MLEILRSNQRLLQRMIAITNNPIRISRLSVCFCASFLRHRYLSSVFVSASMLLGILPGCSRPPEELFRATVETTIDGNDPALIFTPAGLCVDDSGRILVLDDMMSRVDVFSPDGSFLSSFGETGEGPGRLSGLFFNFCVDDAGTVYLIDDRHIIEVFDRNGSFMRSIDPGTRQIFDIAVADSFIVLNCPSPLDAGFGNAVTVIGTDGRLLRRFGESTADLDAMEPYIATYHSSCTIDIDESGDIYCTSLMDYTVCKYTIEGDLIFRSVPESSPGPVVDLDRHTLVSAPVWDLCVDDGMVFVIRGNGAGSDSARVDVFSSETGEFLGFLYTGVPSGGRPPTICVSDGSLYTADADGAVVYKLALDRL